MAETPPPPRGTFGMWLLLGLALSFPLAVTLWDSVQTEGQAPDFRLTSTGYEDGVQGPPVAFGLQDYRGKTLVLDLMATTCKPCEQVTRDVLKPLWAAHGNDTRFAILSVDVWADPATMGSDPAAQAFANLETRDALIALQQRTGVPWRHALDSDQVWLKYTATALPDLLVIAPDGRIVYEVEQRVPSFAEVESAVAASMAGVAPNVAFARLPLAGLAFVAGAASVLTPCTVGMLPAYLGMMLEQARAAPLPQRIRRSLAGGAAAAAGLLVVYAALAGLFWVAGAAVRPWLVYAAPVVGVLMVAAGLLALLGRGVPGFGRTGTSWVSSRGFFTFGVAFGLAGFGCTGPLFLPLLAAGFLESAATGLLLFVAYASAVALVVLLAAALVGEGAVTRFRRVLDWAPGLQRVAGLLMAGAGAYVLWNALAR